MHNLVRTLSSNFFNCPRDFLKSKDFGNRYDNLDPYNKNLGTVQMRIFNSYLLHRHTVKSSDILERAVKYVAQMLV